MAEFIDDVAEYLADQGIGSTTGAAVNIFVGKQPDDPDDCVSIWGLEGGQLPNPNVKAFVYPRFQVLIRNTDYAAGGVKLKAVRDALHVLIGATFDNFYVLRCHVQSEGGPIGQDEKDRFEFSINFYAQARYL